MNNPAATELKKTEEAAPRAAAPAQSRGTSAPDAQAGILGLQRGAGNQAVSRALEPPRQAPTPVPGNLPPAVRTGLQSAGQPLDAQTQAVMAARFGQDFSEVRVRTGPAAAESAHAVGAQAYTIGSNIVFGVGHYAPHSGAGQHLLTHELAHVVQQRRGGAAPALRANTAHESDAVQAATAATAGGSAAQVHTGTAPGLARSPDPDIDEALDRAFPASVPEAEPLPPTAPGQPGQPSQKALTPDELIDDHVFGPRVHEEVGQLRTRLVAAEKKLAVAPNNTTLKKQVDMMRSQLDVLEGKNLSQIGPQRPGTNVPGVGSINTRAAIQIVGPDGKIIALERGYWHPDRHAEQDSIIKLRRTLGKRTLPPGTRMNIAGNQIVCGEI
jgi:hypothetical protein